MSMSMRVLLLALWQPLSLQTHTALPLPKEVEELICEALHTYHLKFEVIDKVCNEVTQKFPQLMNNKMACMMVLYSNWNSAVANCPASQPVPQELVTLLCQLAQHEGMEDRIVDDVCIEVSRLFPDLNLDPDCKTIADSVWDAGFKAICKEHSLPSVRSIEQFVCGVASDKQLEDHAVDEVCKAIGQAFPSAHFSPNCSIAAKRVWDAAVAMCPHGHTSFAMELQIPQEVESLVCELLSEKGIQDEVVDVVCKAAAELFPELKLDSSCKTFMDSLWDAGLSMCPKSKAVLEIATISKGEKTIEEVCDMARSEFVKDMYTKQGCSLLETQFPTMADEKCEELLIAVWDFAVAFCPAEEGEASQGPPMTSTSMPTLEASTPKSDVVII